MELLTTSEMAERWNISRRRVTSFCQEGRIPGAMLKGRTWLLPADTERPEDNRHYNKKEKPGEKR